MQRCVSFIAVVAIVTLLIAPRAEAGRSSLINAALQDGGERLEALQNADGGWFFTVGDPDCGAGAGVSCPNTFGITGLGLIDAYRASKDPSFKAAALDTGNALVAKHAAAPSCDGNPTTGTDRPFTVDVTFLLELSSIAPSNPSKVFKKTAKDWFACVQQDFPTGDLRADNRINGRIAQGLNNLGEWDAALDIEAALAAGLKAYALQEALQVIARQPDWDVATGCTGCEILGRGLLLDVLKPLNGNATVKAAMEAWTADLIAAQLANGSWSDDTQTTAYVLMGLDAARASSAVKKAIDKGLIYLFSQGIGNGGYFVATGDTDEVTEVDSEVLQALWAVR
jgi:hypothetical protein